MIDDIEQRVRSAFAPADREPAITLLPARRADRETALKAAPEAARRWAEAVDFSADKDEFVLAPGADGAVAVAFYGLGEAPLSRRIGGLARRAGGRLYRLDWAADESEAAALAWALGAYRFERYSTPDQVTARLSFTERSLSIDRFERAATIATGVYLARDLVNTPAGDMDPAALESAARELAEAHGARVDVIEGDALLRHDYPMIHAVGRAGSAAPRLIDLRWGDPSAAKLTLVGKGVCFDTGGLDIKPRASMRNMKKDMGGAAAALALAHMIMRLRVPVRLRVLIPAVENNIAANSFRPGDILTSRLGKTVEIGDTDAEGRLVLADALTEAGREAPDLVLDFATLTGAARVALGPEIVPFYTDDDMLAQSLAAAGERVVDPLWRMPLWKGYESSLSSSVADMSNVSSGGFAGSITAALFLRRFVGKARNWCHFDIFAWNPSKKPGRPEGGECQAARAALEVIEERFGAGSAAG